MIVYLAGLISTDHPESIKWREDACYLLGRDVPGAAARSPVRGKDLHTSKDGGITVAHTEGTSKDIITRDYNDIKLSTVMLVNLNTWGSTRPLVGTLMELAWAWQMQMPVVAFCPADNTLMRTHPFIKECVSHYCETMEEAIEFIGRYYK